VRYLAKRGKKQAEIDAIGKRELLPLKSDVIFKMVFADQRNADILRCFLCAVLDIPEKQLEEIAVIDSHLEREFPDDKLGILDVRVLTQSGKRIDIEIQLYEYRFMSERITFYTCKNLTGQIASGEDYEVIRKTITIVILDFSLLDNPAYQHLFRLYDAKNQTQFTDILEIHTLELPKLPPETSNESLLLNWLRLFKANKLEEYEMLATKDPAIKKTVDILKRLSADDKARLAYQAREKAIRDEIWKIRQSYLKGRAEGEAEGRAEGIAEGKAKGMAEGRAEGMAEGQREIRLEVAKNLIAEGNAPEMVAKISGLPLDEIQALSNS
jgi:predicted transposase/invertase (TIGR01784 family)